MLICMMYQKLKVSKSKKNQRNIRQVLRKSSVVTHYYSRCDENLILLHNHE